MPNNRAKSIGIETPFAERPFHTTGHTDTYPAVPAALSLGTTIRFIKNYRISISSNGVRVHAPAKAGYNETYLFSKTIIEEDCIDTLVDNYL
jgi:hypothetical protein